MNDDRDPRAGATLPSAGGLHDFLFDQLPEAYLVIDDARRVVSANARYCGLVGVTPEEVTGRLLGEINQTAPEAQREMRERLLADLLTGLRAGESRLSPVFQYDVGDDAPLAADARGRFWQIRAARLNAVYEGRFLIALQVNDVSARAFAESQLQRERARMRSQVRLRGILIDEAKERLGEHLEQLEQVLAFANIGTWELDVESGEVHCNARCRVDLALAEVGRVSRLDVLGPPTPEDRADVVDSVESALAARRHFDLERSVETGHGTRWVLVRGIGRYQNDGELRSIVGFTLDITDRKQRELQTTAAMEAASVAQQRSEDLARAMDHFVSAVSHELRSPLNAIISWGELLQLSAEPTHVSRASEAIRRNGRQLSSIIDDLLDSGAIASGKLSVELRPVDIGALATLAAEDFRRLAEHKNIRVDAAHVGPCMIHADEKRIRQVLWNLLSNALKFCDAGRIDIATQVMGDVVELTVSDTGRGIEPDALPRIFGRFEQVEALSRGRIGGLGLGLWLVKNIVEAHRGTVVAESAGLGLGATFRVRLPIDPVLRDTP